MDNPGYQKLQKVKANAIEFVTQFCRCCATPVDIWGQEAMICHGCAAADPEKANIRFAELSEATNVALWVDEYIQANEPKPLPSDLR